MSREILNKVKLQSAELMRRMNRIEWSHKTPNGKSNTYTDRLKNCSADLLSAKEIQVQFDCDEEIEICLNNPILRKKMLLIAKEAFNNIAKHSGASMDEVEIKKDSSKLVFRISDNGRGMTATGVSKGNELENEALRCRQMEAKFEVKSEPGAGLTIMCSIPMAKISYLGSDK